MIILYGLYSITSFLKNNIFFIMNPDRLISTTHGLFCNGVEKLHRHPTVDPPSVCTTKKNYMPIYVLRFFFPIDLHFYVDRSLRMKFEIKRLWASNFCRKFRYEHSRYFSMFDFDKEYENTLLILNYYVKLVERK